MLIPVLEDLKREGCVVSVRTFKIIFNISREANLLEQARELLDHMKDLNCRPDSTIYNSLICLLTEARCMDMAETMVKRMSGWGSSPNIITYSALIKGFHDLGQIEDA